MRPKDTRARESAWQWPRAFSHPLWWAGLALLVLNDHLWKGGGVLPGALTGKLSDIAGMLVAPPLAALALGAGRPQARRLAVLLVAVGFASIKLVPQAAHALEQGVRLLGIAAHVCLDPSDLWTLLALPLGYGLCRPVQQSERARHGPALGWTRRSGLLLGSLACVATSGSNAAKDGARGDAPSVKNAGSSTLTLVISSTEGAGGCSIYRDDRISLLTSNAFTTQREVTLKAGETAALPLDTSTTPCGAASIGLPDGDSTLIFWRELDTIASFVPADDAQRLARIVTITGKTGHFNIDLGEDLKRFELGGDPPSPTCKQAELSSSLEATPLAMAQGFLELSEVRTAQDGCFEVDWFASPSDTSPDTQRLCVPDWAFPFAAGDRLSVTQALGSRGGYTLRITGFSGNAIDRQLVIWSDAMDFPDSQVKGLAASDCVGSLSSCGAYVRPATVRVHGKDLSEGQELTIKGDMPKQVRVLIGPARDVAWSSPSCTGPEAHVGQSASVLELRSY